MNNKHYLSEKYELQLASLEEDENGNEKYNEKNIEEKKLEEIPYKLQVLLAGTVMACLLSFLTPQDSFEFLSSHKSLQKSDTPWTILEEWLELKEFREFGLSILPNSTPSSIKRDLATYAVKKLGYNCTNCYCPLKGQKNVGLFACTSLCTACSEKRFKFEESDYVDGTIRFYLCGEDSITTKGLAFLSYPFWISIDDISEKVMAKHKSALHLAQCIYEEKIFFKKYAPVSMGRPRDDKATTIRRMIEIDKEEKLKSVKKSISIFCPLRYSINSNTDDCNYTDSEPAWRDELPSTLVNIYNEQKSREKSGLGITPPLTCQPLRELVQTMHEKDNSSIKRLAPWVPFPN